MYVFPQNSGYSAVHTINLSSVKTSNFIQFTRPNKELTYNESMEKYENYFFKLYILWHICMSMYAIIFQW
jgi:hypothetical protein